MPYCAPFKLHAKVNCRDVHEAHTSAYHASKQAQEGTCLSSRSLRSASMASCRALISLPANSSYPAQYDTSAFSCRAQLPDPYAVTKGAIAGQRARPCSEVQPTLMCAIKTMKLPHPWAVYRPHVQRLLAAAAQQAGASMLLEASQAAGAGCVFAVCKMQFH